MIKLRKMTSEEYSNYMKFSVANYADEKQKGEGLTPEEALKVAQDSYVRLLPQGLETPDQFIFSVIDDSSQKPIGMLWFAKKSQSGKLYAFIYDIVLNPEKRGQGLGKQLMALMETEARALGCTSVGLHVFGHNTAAIALYEKSGFYTTNRMMKKDFV